MNKLLMPPQRHLLPPQRHLLPPQRHLLPPQRHLLPPQRHLLPLRSRHLLGDFTHWKDHDAYQKALDRLLRDLRVEKA
jgi:hypothetical protein